MIRVGDHIDAQVDLGSSMRYGTGVITEIDPVLGTVEMTMDAGGRAWFAMPVEDLQAMLDLPPKGADTQALDNWLNH